MTFMDQEIDMGWFNLKRSIRRAWKHCKYARDEFSGLSYKPPGMESIQHYDEKMVKSIDHSKISAAIVRSLIDKDTQTLSLVTKFVPEVSDSIKKGIKDTIEDLRKKTCVKYTNNEGTGHTNYNVALFIDPSPYLSFDSVEHEVKLLYYMMIQVEKDIWGTDFGPLEEPIEEIYARRTARSEKIW